MPETYRSQAMGQISNPDALISEFEMHHKALGELNERLRDRLSPVLKPEPPTVSCNKLGISCPVSPFRNVSESIADAIRGLRATIDQIDL